jgi:formate hydrogenlyase subunit 4
VLIATLLANLLVPPGMAAGAAFLMTLAVLALCAVAVGIVESSMARARMSHVPQFIFLMMALSATAFAVVMFFLHGGAHV